MFFQISNALKKQFVLIFEDIFQKHPIFKKVEVFTKFPDEDRPKHALLVRSVSGSSQKLSLDNFIRTASQFSSLANLKGVMGNSIEWVKDDTLNIDKISAPGFYVITMTSDRAFKVSPFLIVDNEKLEIEFIEGKQGAYLKNLPVNPDSEIIFTNDGIDFKKDIEYTIDYTTGKILFQNSVDKYNEILCDYQIVGEVTVGHDIDLYCFDNEAIPGVIIAFGDRLREGDEQVVIVETRQRDVAKVYGGRWNLSIDLIGLSQDPDQQERLVDYAVSIFWAEWQDRLVDEGINVFDFSLSGESEDLEVEIPEEYSYTGGITFTAEVDWEMFIPLITEIRRVSYNYGSKTFKDGLTVVQEAKYDKNQFDSRMIGSGHRLGLQLLEPSIDPVVVRPAISVRTRNYTEIQP